MKASLPMILLVITLVGAVGCRSHKHVETRQSSYSHTSYSLDSVQRIMIGTFDRNRLVSVDTVRIRVEQKSDAPTVTLEAVGVKTRTESSSQLMESRDAVALRCDTIAVTANSGVTDTPAGGLSVPWLAVVTAALLSLITLLLLKKSRA